MIVTIERVSKFGVLLSGDPDWKNLSKFDPVSLAGVHAGDTVDIELKKNKYIVSINKLGSTDPNTSGVENNHSESSQLNNSGPTTSGSSPREVSTRQTAVNAVLGSPLLLQLTKDLDNASAMQLAKDLTREFATYALTGSFSPVPSEGLPAGVGHS